jgi:hypothetical protein
MGKFGSNILKDRKIYGNCLVYSPEGHLMFRCDQKKANWYLNRNLADVVQNEPLTIKLNFVPRGFGNHDKPFGLSEMRNTCVNCGTEDFLTRHHVVPICYRKHFPLSLKSHNFHDVLSMCMDCHEKYERKADTLKRELADKYKAPINGICIDNRNLLKAIKNCNTLLRGTENIPDERIHEIKNEIRNFLGRDFIQSDIIEISMKKQTILEKTHGQFVMESIGDDIQSFIKLWREHFTEHNECKYLPDNWNINNVIIINE